MVYLGDYLGCHVSRSATESIYRLIFFAAQTKAKIDEFELAVPIDQDVFSLDVSVNDLEIVEVE